MNDNDKFRNFFGFGKDRSESSVTENGSEAATEQSDEKLQAAVTEWQEKYLNLTAEFQNYQKRVSQERADWSFEAQKAVFLDLLTIVDNFERALEAERKH